MLRGKARHSHAVSHGSLEGCRNQTGSHSLLARIQALLALHSAQVWSLQGLLSENSGTPGRAVAVAILSSQRGFPRRKRCVARQASAFACTPRGRLEKGRGHLAGDRKAGG